jgi:hypothetical protein
MANTLGMHWRAIHVVAVAACTVAMPAAADDAADKANRTLRKASKVELPPLPRATMSGFRMEGDPEVEVVFGDTDHYRQRIDNFFTMDQAMDTTRANFTRYVQGALTMLGQKKRGCPADKVAPFYSRAHDAAESFRRLGVTLETEYTAIRALNRYGETDGLTPSYRWKVNKVRGIYRRSLVDYREIRVALVGQLQPELKHRGCKLPSLRARGQGASLPALPASGINASQKVRRRKQDKAPKIVPASTVTFFVDNRKCKKSVTVFTDGASLGKVAAGEKSAFQTLAGNHVICLIPEDSRKTCGQAGTVRTAYIHDAWSMTLHCQ